METFLQRNNEEIPDNIDQSTKFNWAIEQSSYKRMKWVWMMLEVAEYVLSLEKLKDND